MSYSCKFYDIPCQWNYVFDEIKSFFIWAYDSIVTGLIQMISAIPVPEFMNHVQTFSMPSGVAYFASAFEIPYGVGLIVTAYGVRFLIRRIPIVG